MRGQFLQALRRSNIFQWGQCLSDTFITHCLHNCVIVKSYDWNFCPATLTMCAPLRYMALFVSTRWHILQSTNDTLTVTVSTERYAWWFFYWQEKNNEKKKQTNSKLILLRSHAPKVTKPFYIFTSYSKHELKKNLYKIMCLSNENVDTGSETNRSNSHSRMGHFTGVVMLNEFM